MCTKQSTQEHLEESIGIKKKQSGECPSQPEKNCEEICFVRWIVRNWCEGFYASMQEHAHKDAESSLAEGKD